MKIIQVLAVLAFAASMTFAGEEAKPKDANAAQANGAGGITVIRAGQVGGMVMKGGAQGVGDSGLGRWEPMKADANMTAEQQTKVKQIVQKYWDKRREWYASDEAKKSRELYQKLNELGKKDDEQSQKQREQVRKEIAEGQAKQAKMATDEETEVLGLLKPEQRLAWEKASLGRRMAGQLRPLGLSEKQQGKVDELVEKASFKYVDLKDLSDRKKLDDALLDEIARDVLDAAQGEKLKEMRAHRQGVPQGGRTTTGRIMIGGAGGAGGQMIIKVVGGAGGIVVTGPGNVVVEEEKEPTSKPAEEKK